MKIKMSASIRDPVINETNGQKHSASELEVQLLELLASEQSRYRVPTDQQHDLIIPIYLSTDVLSTRCKEQ